MIVSFIVTLRLKNDHWRPKHAPECGKRIEIIEFVCDDLNVDQNISMLP